MRNGPPYQIESVDRALRLILLLKQGQPVSVREVAEQLAVAGSTAHRLLAMLCHHGFAVQDDDRRYRAGPELGAAGARPLPVPQLTRLLRPRLSALHDELGETVHLVVPDGRDVQFVDGVEGDQGLRVGLRTGMRMPAHCASAGKTMLAALTAAELEQLYPDGLPPWRTARITSMAALIRQLATVRAKGYGFNAEESEVGVTAIGVRLADAEGRTVGGLSVAVPSARFDRTDERRLADALVRAAVAAQADLAGR